MNSMQKGMSMAKYKLESNFIALKEQRTWHRLMLKEARKITWTEKICDCGTDAKKLYTLINNLTNKPRTILYRNLRVMRG